MTRSPLRTCIPVAMLLAFGACDCSDDDDPVGGMDAGPMVDTGPRPDVPRVDGGGTCGNALMEGGEECDDGNTTADDGCAADCTLECGDGAVTGDELCDTGIADGEAGACPASCDDGDACTTDALDGVDCSQECVFGPITAAMNGDGCCPDGATPATDDDCAATCGDGVVEGSETCDTAIAAGDPGACPADCDDGMVCTADMLTDPGTCMAACSNTAITMAMDGDGCCPAGETIATDDDCTGTCGDGTVSGGEACDTAIAPGSPGACPSACDDSMACTTDMLTGGGTCAATCTNTPITMATDGDGCCPTGATIATDDDCAARCGDGVVTAPETCDDGNMASGDGCSDTCMTEVTSTAFRFTDLDLMDPHVFASVPILGCTDVTNLSLFGTDGVNPQLQTSIQTDDDGDGELDLSLAHVFEPLVQMAGTTTMSSLVFPDCTAPMSSTMCTLPAGAMRTTGTATNMGSGATCLGIVMGTTGGYSPAITTTVAPGGGTCYVAMAGTVMFDLAGITITLRDAAIAGEWFGVPATEIRDGLIRGFLSEADANSAIVPEGTTGIDSIDGEPVASLLRGGTGNCSRPAPMTGDTDTHMGMRGWWFYLNFEAVQVPYTEL